MACSWLAPAAPAPATAAAPRPAACGLLLNKAAQQQQHRTSSSSSSSSSCSRWRRLVAHAQPPTMQALAELHGVHGVPVQTGVRQQQQVAPARQRSTSRVGRHAHHQQQQQQPRHQQQQQQQQQQQLLLQRIAACSDWRQVLPLVGACAAADALVAAALRAAQLPPNSAAAAAAGFGVDHHRHEQLQYRRLLQHLLRTAAASLRTGTAPPTARQLSDLLTQLSAASVRLPGEFSAAVLAHACKQAHAWQSEELAAVLAGLACHRPKHAAKLQQQQQHTILQSFISSRSHQQQQQEAIVGSEPTRGSKPSTAAAATAQLPLVLWAVGRMRWRVEQQWLQPAAIAVLQQLSSCTAAQQAMAIWGLACLCCDIQQLDQQQQQQLWRPQPYQQHVKRPLQHAAPLASQQLLEAVAQQATAFSAHELVAVLWAVAQLQLQPQPQLVQQLLRQCQQPAALQQYTDVDISSILLSLAHMQHHHGHLQQRAPAQPYSRSSSSTSTSTSSNEPRQTGRLHTRAVEPLLQALLLQLPASDPQHLVRALWTVSALQLRPPGPWVGRVLGHLQPLLQHMRRGRLVTIATAVASLQYLPSPDWLASWYAATLVHLQQQQAAVAAQKAGGAAHGTAGMQAAASPAAAAAAVPAAAQELTALAAAVLRISRSRRCAFDGQKPPAAWLDALAAASLPLLPGLEPDGLATWGAAMRWFGGLAGEPWPGPGQRWWAAYVAASQPLLAAAAPRQLAGIATALSEQKQHAPPHAAWAAALLDASRPLLAGPDGGSGGSGMPQQQQQAASAADLVGIGKALARMRVLPPEPWLQQWVLALERRSTGMTPSLNRTRAWTRHTWQQLGAAQEPGAAVR